MTNTRALNRLHTSIETVRPPVSLVNQGLEVMEYNITSTVMKQTHNPRLHSCLYEDIIIGYGRAVASVVQLSLPKGVFPSNGLVNSMKTDESTQSL